MSIFLLQMKSTSSDGLMVLKLSIFVGNAEMTDLFKCEKSKTTCCSPKSAIKEEKTRLQRIKYQIRRKDTEIQNTQFIEVRYDIHSSFVISIYLLLHFYPLFFGLIL